MQLHKDKDIYPACDTKNSPQKIQRTFMHAIKI